MDNSWIQLKNRMLPAFEKGMKDFLNFAYENKDPESKISCPCMCCNNFFNQSREVVANNFVLRGVVKGYDRWIYHGADFGSCSLKDNVMGLKTFRMWVRIIIIPKMTGDVATGQLGHEWRGVEEHRCHYEVLGLGRDYTADEIRSAYCRLALQRHPDKLSQFGFSPTEDTVLMAPMPMVPWMSIPPSSKRQAVLSDADPNKPVFGNPTYNGIIAGKVSGRRSSSSKVSLKRSTFEQRAKENEIKRAYKERITELKEEIRTNKVEKKKKREKKKRENILKFGTKLQKITNPKTGTVTPPQSRFSLAQTSISGGTNYRREVAGTDTTTSHKKKKKKRRRLPNRLSPSPSMSFA
ncbi:hypothetical protein RJ640_025060 [Escallonia rubra]|uniref:Coiled-coil domain-containing protein 86 n=1 Tax=Escallonia rubra TaxID=112253 RepID=A0AA88R7Q6_9ASTE|nr:hypothetical protein RJ640_025060 [Escallonia rubra]